MSYAEFAPPSALVPWVRCAWVFESDVAGETPERIVPDGRPELVVHWKRPFMEIGSDGRVRSQPSALLAGQLTRPLHLRSDGPAGVVGVRFHPDGARAFYGAPMRATLDRRVALEEFAPGATGTLVRAVGAAASPEARAAVALGFVQRHMDAGLHEGDPAVRACVSAIEGGHADLTYLAATLGLGRRTLERRFADAVGVGPALLASIFRFRRVFDLIEHDSTRPWTEAALAAGYYDQSHFIREFRRFVGCRPSEFFGTPEGLSEALLTH